MERANVRKAGESCYDFFSEMICAKMTGVLHPNRSNSAYIGATIPLICTEVF